MTGDPQANHPPPLEDYDALGRDAALGAALTREGADWCRPLVQQLGEHTGSAHYIRAGELANRFEPQLRTCDRFGERLDRVDFHPAYHELMQLALGYGMHAIAWNEQRPGAHVAHAAMVYLMAQVETGVCCPAAMTYASVPSLRHSPALAAFWLPRVQACDYDGRFLPASDKAAVTVGMAMTEKQGGSDVRANTTRAVLVSGDTSGDEYQLEGHKWFCSAPMSDAFLTLANTAAGLTCFLAPRWLPDGSRNRIFIQRLKDKCGNRSNASSEIEYHDTWCRRVGEDGDGVRTIIDMVHHTRLDATVAPAALMRQALVQAIHHTRHRRAFGGLLVEQPLMRAVLADMALEVEAALMLVMWVAKSFDDATSPLARITTAIAKYWVNKRTPALVYEAMECLGGGGYVEESIMPRLYREAPVNSIWEGSGNVIALDILRALHRQPDTRDALVAVLEPVRGASPAYDACLDDVHSRLTGGSLQESEARFLAERLALTLQCALMYQHAATDHAGLFSQSRLGKDRAHTYGALPDDPRLGALIDHAWPPES